jgi:hypothetical protein
VSLTKRSKNGPSGALKLLEVITRLAEIERGS